MRKGGFFMDQKFDIEERLKAFIEMGDYEIIDSTEYFYRSYNKTELIALSRQLGKPIKTKYKKAEVVDLFMKQFMNEETLTKGLITINDRAYELLDDIVHDDVTGHLLNLIDLLMLDRLETKGFFFIADSETFVISKEASKMVKKIFKNKDYQALRPKLSYLNAIISYCDIVYGVINLNYVQLLYQYKFPKATAQEVLDLYHQLPDPAMTYDEEKKDFLSDFVTRENVYDDVVKLHQQNIISLPSKEELDDYLYYGFPYSNQAYLHLLFFLIINSMDDLTQPIHDVHELFKAVSFEVPFQDLLTYYDDYIIDDDMLEMFVPIIMECFNTSRHFKSNGHIPDEDMMNLLKSGGSIPLPDDEHLLDELKSHLDELHDMGFDINDYNEVVLKDRDDTDGFVS